MATPTTLPASFTSGQVLTAAQMNDLRGAFRVLQVVQTVKTDTFSTSSTSLTDITGLSVSITPSSTSSKILVLVDCRFGTGSTSTNAQIALLRGSTNIYLGDAAGSRRQAFFGTQEWATTYHHSVNAIFLDSPATTSATTYKLQMASQTATVYINRTGSDTDGAGSTRTASSITVMEISA